MIVKFLGAQFNAQALQVLDALFECFLGVSMSGRFDESIRSSGLPCTWNMGDRICYEINNCYILWYCMQVYEHSFEAPVRKCIYNLNFNSLENNCNHRRNNNYRIGKIGVTGKHARWYIEVEFCKAWAPRKLKIDSKTVCLPEKHKASRRRTGGRVSHLNHSPTPPPTQQPSQHYLSRWWNMGNLLLLEEIQNPS